MDPAPAADDIATWLSNLYDSDLRLPVIASVHWPFTIQDLVEGFASLPADKALAPAFAPAPVWIQSAEQIAQFLHPILTAWSQSPHHQFPDTWGSGHLVFLHKPGKKGCRPSDLRPIALLEPSNKIVMGLLAQALMHHIGHVLRAVPQFAYHEARGCGDAVDQLTHHCRTVQKMHMHHQYKHNQSSLRATPDLHGGLMLSLDLSKAFDRVNRQKLLQGMERMGVPIHLIHLLNNIYHRTSFTFEYRGEFREVETHQGIRQGCKAAPCCWSIFITDILHTLLERTDLAWIRHNNTVYADDWITHALIHCQFDFHQAIHRLGVMLDLLEECDMLINFDKTKAMLSLKGSALKAIQKRYILRTHSGTFLCIPRKTGTSRIQLVNHLPYLGITLSYHRLETATLETRLKSGHTAVALLHRWLFSRQPLRLKHRIAVWRQCILPCHWYGLFHVGFRLHDLVHLDQHWMKQLRRITCTPAHLTHVSNIALLQQFAIPDPLAQLRVLGLHLQARRKARSITLEPTDILHFQPPCRLSDLIAIIDQCVQVRRNPDPSPRDLDPGWTCLDCALTFENLAQYRRHLTMTHGQRTGQLRDYQLTEARRGEPTCSRCQAMFTSWHAFRYHIQFVCLQSPQVMDTDDAALTHRAELRRLLLANLFNMHLDTTLCEQLTTCCCLCLRICTGEQGLLRHFAQDHNAEYSRHGLFLDRIEQNAMKSSPCSYCLIPFQNHHQCVVLRQLAMLMAHDHPTIETPAVSDRMFQCHCGKAYVTAHGLAQHKARVHANTGNILTDEERSLIVSTLVTEDWQEILDNPAILRALTTGCLLCEQSFSKRALLTRHLRQEHAKYWSQAAAQAYQLESLYKEEGTCFCDPQLESKHTCVIFLQLALLQRHWTDTCQEDMTPSTTDIPPAPLIAPNFRQMIQLSLRMGSVDVILQSQTIKLHLSTRCMQCNRYHDDMPSLLNHLMQDHASEWTDCLPFLTLLLNTFFTTKGCTCVPAISKGPAAHICVTLAQIALIAGSMTDFLVLPFRFTGLELTPKLCSWLRQEHLQQMLDWLLSRNFEAVMKADWLPSLLQTGCIVCGQAFLAEDLAVHLWNYHVNIMEHASPVLQMLIPVIAAIVPEMHCPMCHALLEDDATQTLMDHMLQRCPVMLQLAIIFTMPNHAHDPYQDCWPPAKKRRQAMHRRQLTLTDGMVRLLQPLDPTDSMLISTWHQLIQHVFTEPQLLELLRLKCWHCQQLFLTSEKLLQHLCHFHDADSARIQICYAHLAQDLPAVDPCPLSCEVVHSTTPCLVLLQLACILCNSDGQRRPSHAEHRRGDDGLLEAHHPTWPLETVVGAAHDPRGAQSQEEQATQATHSAEDYALFEFPAFRECTPVADGPESPDSAPRRCPERSTLRTTVLAASRSGRTWHPTQSPHSHNSMACSTRQDNATASPFSSGDHPAPEGTPGLPAAPNHDPGDQAECNLTEHLQRRWPDALPAVGCQSPEADPEPEAATDAAKPSAEGAGLIADGHEVPFSDPSIPCSEEADLPDRGSTIMSLAMDSQCESRLPDERGAAQVMLSFGLASYWRQMQTTDGGPIPVGQRPPEQTAELRPQLTLQAVRVLNNPLAKCCFANAPLLGLTWQTLLISHLPSGGWERGAQLFEKLVFFTPQPLFVVEDSDFQAAFRGFWTEFNVEADAFDFTDQMLLALRPRLLCNGWTTQQEFKGLAKDTELASLKSPDLVPVQLNVFPFHAESCTLTALIGAWHDVGGFPKGLLQPSHSVVLSVPRTNDDGTQTNMMQILECDATFTMPYFQDLTGTFLHQAYVTVGLTFHLGQNALRGHYRTALRVTNGWLAYEDGRAPTFWKGLQLPSHAMVVLIWAIRADHWHTAQRFMPTSSSSAANPGM
eukprot:Skav224675  [mRNA]  locus=scaffold4044:164743:170382:+ [translate_table: standard]